MRSSSDEILLCLTMLQIHMHWDHAPTLQRHANHAAIRFCYRSMRGGGKAIAGYLFLHLGNEAIVHLPYEPQIIQDLRQIESAGWAMDMHFRTSNDD